MDHLLKSISESNIAKFFEDNKPVLEFDTVDKMTTADKYIRTPQEFSIGRLLSENFINYLLTGISITYNKTDTSKGHLLSFDISKQDLQNDSFLKKDGSKVDYKMNAVRSFLNKFLLELKDSKFGNRYNGDKFLQSQINPKWRLKPISVIRQENSGKDSIVSKFLNSLDLYKDVNTYTDRVSFNSNLVDSPEGLAELEQSIHGLNSLTNIYVYKDKQGNWVNVPSDQYESTEEMGEVIFNLLRSSIYTDKFKFASNRVSAIIPVEYSIKIFQSLDAALNNMLLHNKNLKGEKYYFDYNDPKNLNNRNSSINNIKENILINSIISVNDLLPKLSRSLKGKKFQAGITNTGNMYDLSVSKTEFDNQESSINKNVPAIPDQSLTDETKNYNDETKIEANEEKSNEDLAKKLKDNPAFVSLPVYDNGKLKAQNDIYMRVGETLASKDDITYHYKYIGRFNGTLNNNSFDPDLLSNKYKIADYFNNQRFNISVNPEIDFENANTLQLDDVKISGTGITSLFTYPGSKEKASHEKNALELLSKIKSIGLYDVRKPDRIGLTLFNIKSYKLSEDKKSVSLLLERSKNQIDFKKNNLTLDVLSQVSISKQEKIEQIRNSIELEGQDVSTMSDKEIESAFRQLQEIEAIKKDKQDQCG